MTFTPTQQRILGVLSDGVAHKREDLMACLNDDMTTLTTLTTHLCLLRRKLRKKGEDIISVSAPFQPGKSPSMYQHVRLLGGRDE